jgi:hypothetical protein
MALTPKLDIFSKHHAICQNVHQLATLLEKGTGNLHVSYAKKSTWGA